MIDIQNHPNVCPMSTSAMTMLKRIATTIARSFVHEISGHAGKSPAGFKSEVFSYISDTDQLKDQKHLSGLCSYLVFKYVNSLLKKIERSFPLLGITESDKRIKDATVFGIVFSITGNSMNKNF